MGRGEREERQEREEKEEREDSRHALSSLKLPRTHIAYAFS